MEVKFFVCKTLIENIAMSKQKIMANKSSGSMKNEPLFIYAFALYESAIIESIRHLFFAFPEKFGSKDSSSSSKKIDIGTVFDNAYTPAKIIHKIIDNYIRSLGKGSLVSITEEAFKKFDISLDVINDEMTKLKELSKMRNTIVHDNSSSDQSYILGYGQGVKKITISNENLDESIDTYCAILDVFSKEIHLKYGKFTIELLLRNLWNEIFITPLLPFDSCFIIKSKIQMNIDFLHSVKNSLSSGEKYFLALFLSNYNTTLVSEWFRELPMSISILDKEGIRKVLYLFELYPYLLNGMNI